MNPPILVKTPAQRSFAQQLSRLEAYCAITGNTLDDCIVAALQDYIDVVVEAKISQFDKLTESA